MKNITQAESFPKQDKTDLTGVEWRTRVLVRYGIDQHEAYSMALFLSGMELAADRYQERMLARVYRP